METFIQMWSNTNKWWFCIGGSAMTEQRTYVFIPMVKGENCQVYFSGGYAYSVPYSDVFMGDVRNRQVKGLHGKKKYFEN